MGHKRFISDLSPEEWEKRRKSLIHPDPVYWIMLAFVLVTATIVLVLNLVADTPDPLFNILLAVGVGVLWVLAINAAARRINKKGKQK